MENMSMDMLVSLRLIKKIIKENCIRSDLKQKLDDSLTFYNVKASSAGLKLLAGLENLEPPTFTFDEREELRRVLSEQFAKEMENIDESKSKGPRENTVSDQILLKAREELHSTFTTYGGNLVTYNNMLDEMRKLRMETMPEVCCSKLVETKQQNKLLKAKLTLLNYTTQVQIFKENETSLAAYRELITEVRKMQDAYEKEIGELREVKAKYDTADSEEYREILEEYLHYTNAIDRKMKFEEAMKDM